MPPPPLPAIRPLRFDLSELKLQLAKRLGPERARRYFSYLHRLLSQKLSKAEFNKLCFLTLGRENVPLHNQLIKSVIKNAFLAKTPPQLKNSLQRSNGDILLQSPRRHRSSTQRSKLGFNERSDFTVQENGHLFSSNGIDEVLVREDGGSMEQNSYLLPSRGPLEAPLGIPFCPVSVGWSKRSLSPAGIATIGNFTSFLDNSGLCHTEDLRKRMEKIVEAHGLGGVTLDSANLLNNGLDAYLKRLIKSSIDLVQARVGHRTIEPLFQKKEAYGNPINGICMNKDTLDLQETNCCLINLLDFTAAMRLNPRKHGEDASLSLEKICLHSYEN